MNQENKLSNELCTKAQSPVDAWTGHRNYDSDCTTLKIL